MIDPILQTFLAAGCPFTPMGVIVLGDKSPIKGKVVTLNAWLVLVLVWQGEVEVASFNTALPRYLNAGCTIILAFERREDFRKIEKITLPAPFLSLWAVTRTVAWGLRRPSNQEVSNLFNA